MRTPANHMHHSNVPACGCATPDNTTKDTLIFQCPCGAAYHAEVISAILDFICHDCKRAVHHWRAHRGLTSY